MRTMLQPCVSCGARVPEGQEHPYRGHRRGCALVAEWRASHRGGCAKADAEIVRLRTAMVLAMADCEAESALAGSPITRKSLMAIAEGLKAALEKP